jgi:hypothetical protein
MNFRYYGKTGGQTKKGTVDAPAMREAIETLANRYALGRLPETGVLAACVHVTAADGSFFEVTQSGQNPRRAGRLTLT